MVRSVNGRTRVGMDYDANQSNASNQPTLQQNTINGKPAVLFDGSNDFIAGQSRLGLPVNPAISVFVVCKPLQNSSSDNRMLHIGGDSNSLSVGGGSDGWSWRYDGGNEIYSTVNLGSEYVLAYVRPAGGDFSSASFFIYGIEQTRTNGGNDNGLPSSNETVFTVGSNSDGSRTFYNGAIGEIIVTDSDSNEIRQKTEGYLAQKWGLGANLPSSHPFKNDSSLFSLDANGSLTANQIFDFETDDRNYSITVFATDDHNATFDKNFTITVTNVVEDLDGDGTEDHYDDIDGDGLTNAEELAYNSDPWDASSGNRPPSDINASNLTIAENSAIGTVIGEFNATDPDGEGNFTYAIFLTLRDSLVPIPWLSPYLMVHADGNLSQN